MLQAEFKLFYVNNSQFYLQFSKGKFHPKFKDNSKISNQTNTPYIKNFHKIYSH